MRKTGDLSLMKRDTAKNFQDLIVWQKAHKAELSNSLARTKLMPFGYKLVLAIYRLSGKFPKDELYGLTSQIRRSAVSVPANIAEGFRKSTRPD